jgi:predicted Rossmann fold flavoprotein
MDTVINMDSNKHIIVIGAGAAGMMAAGRAAESGASVTVIEKGDRPGRKLLLTGNGRCNLTNSRPLPDFISAYGESGSFLRNIFSRFFREQLLDLLKKYGVNTVTEPDGRFFPESGSSQSVVNALQGYMARNRVNLILNNRVKSLDIINGCVAGIQTDSGYIPAGAVILAAGGASYPGTGSNGDGFSLAEQVSHSIVTVRPSLVPLRIKETIASRAQGVSLKNIRITAYSCSLNSIPDNKLTGKYGRGLSRGKPPEHIIESRIGDVVFTHFGISGPAVLLTSLAVADFLQHGPVSVALDLFPDIEKERFDRQIVDLIINHGQRTLRRILNDLLPDKIVEPLLDIMQIPPDIRASYITSEQRKQIISTLKSLRFSISGTLPLKDALVTAGGVSLKEIDPRTLMSRLVQGLFFCGEVMDIDADTGGYNLQAAFSTGYTAGEGAAKWVKSN